ncbi:PAS domain-containing sensor histidine kinase [Bacteroides sp.]|uniref:sensor histidine kinase n=1 Tax=Bacteroides sp. TaxID=29523 RepID=UPI00262AA441|nr:PAS domain-containing sensor histidine kinase [Bacteroides sp.]MDD3037809.1 PAS domain-containing sensor histidine kinase [Bacteroides sp.]
MKFVYPKYKYIFIIICLIITFICGYNFKRWYLTNNKVEKYISLIYSFSENEIGYKKFEELIKQEFRKQGIEPVFNRFYLDCNKADQKTEIGDVRKYLENIKNKPADLILTVGDQSTNALLLTGHRLLSSIPVIACNVHFPDEKLLEKYKTRKIYVLRDSPDFKRNIEFIKSLQPQKSIEIIYNIDLTPLARQSFDLLTHIVDRKNVRFLSPQSAFTIERDYKEIRKMIEYYCLMPAVTNHNKKEDLIISLYPFQYIKNNSLLSMMDKLKSDQEKRVFLLDKFDLAALPIVNALNIPSFSCSDKGFGEGTKIVGGYMATKEISARTAVDLAVRLFNKDKIGIIKIRDLEKEYVLDWTYFSIYTDYDIKNASSNVRIINYSFHDRYRKELYFFIGLFSLAFILISIILLRIYRRSLIEQKNLKILQKAHKRLTLSTDGGQISLWNMHMGEIEFDDLFVRLTGLEQRRFTQTDFFKYVHPDDFQPLKSFHETLHKSPSIQIQRIRFCFNDKNGYQWYEFRYRSLTDAQGEMMLVGIMQNIQELVEREHQLILAKEIAEKAELKQSFLNNISHEIRTPLNAIVGFTNLLVESGDEIDQDEKKSMLEIINHNNELLLKLINDVLEISHLDSGNMDFDIKEWDVTKIIKEIYYKYKPLIQSCLQFHLDLDETVTLPVNIDRSRLIQVISNFLNNANKFTRNGNITLGCEIGPAHNEVSIYVKDSGKGIDKKELMMIFNRFYKSDEFGQGSGLGLPICKVIIEKLSGRIEVHSEVGKGSCFTIILSLAKKESHKNKRFCEY